MEDLQLMIGTKKATANADIRKQLDMALKITFSTNASQFAILCPDDAMEIIKNISGSERCLGILKSIAGVKTNVTLLRN